MAVAARDEIDALVEFEGRGPGRDAERRAARHLATRFEELGREADTEQVDCWPRWHAALALTLAAVVLGSVVAVDYPLAGTVIVFAAALAPPLSRRALGRRASQNVLSWEGGDKEGTIVLVAHYDAGRRPLRLRLDLVVWALATVLLCCVLRLAGLEGTALTVVQFIPTIALIAAAPVLVDMALAPVGEGRNDNASGVAAALALADRRGGTLENFDLWILLTGAQGSLADGMRGFMRRHRKGLDSRRTVFINLDTVGQGSVRFGSREGLPFPRRMHPQLVAICEQIAEDSPLGAAPVVIRERTDAGAAHGFPSITITCRGDDAEASALAAATAFCSELLDRLDAEIGPRLSEPEPSASSRVP